MRWLRTIVPLVLCLLLAGPASASVYRCVDAQGKTYFSDAACPMARSARHSQPQDDDRALLQAPPSAPAPAIAPPASPAPHAPSAAVDWSTPPDGGQPPTPEVSPPAASQDLALAHPVATGVMAALSLTGAAWLFLVMYREFGLMGAIVVDEVPLARWAYIIQNFRAVLGPLLLFALTFLILAVIAWRDVKAGFVQSRSNTYRCIGPGMPEPNPSSNFAFDDVVCLRSTLSMKGNRTRPPPRSLQWQWYRGVVPASRKEADAQLQAHEQAVVQETTALALDWGGDGPREVIGQMPARQLGVGWHSVSISADGLVLDTINFEVH